LVDNKVGFLSMIDVNITNNNVEHSKNFAVRVESLFYFPWPSTLCIADRSTEAEQPNLHCFCQIDFILSVKQKALIPSCTTSGQGPD
jgi:hypothetical protein